jgi:putative FmdB family regulatory protein
MPIYEYQCKSCGHALEAIQKISDEPLKFCPECGQPALNKLISAAGFRLKGGGWYETDFKKSDKKKNLAEGGSKPESAPTPAPSADSSKAAAPSS